MVPEKVRWGLELAAVRALALKLKVLPHRARLAAGRGLGRAVFALDSRHRAVALENLAAAYPGSDPAWRRDVGRNAFRHLGRLLVEILLQGPDAAAELESTRIEGWEHLLEVCSEGKGYFLLSGHFGNWERVAHLQAALGHPLWMVARPLDNPYLEVFFRKRRESTGNRVVYKRNAVREMMRGLKAGRGIAFVIDQNFGEAGRVFVPFFGRPAATTPVLGSLAVRMGAPVLPVFAFPEPGGGYRVVYERPLEPARSSDPDTAAAEITAAPTARIEAAVRQCPEAWFWMHRRWRTRPEEEGVGEALEESKA